MRRVQGFRRWSWAVGMLALGGVALGTSCLRVDFEHCMFAGGDLACGEDFCVGAVGGPSDAIEGGKPNGCIDALPMEEDGSWVHLPCGLPVAVRMADAPAGFDPERHTVEGIVTEMLRLEGLAFDVSKDGCEDVLEGLSTLAGVRARIEGEDRKRTSVAKLAFRPGELTQIRDFETDFEQALMMFRMSCVEVIDATGTSTGVDTTATEEGSTATTDGPMCTDEQCLADDPTRPICGSNGMCVGCNGAGGDAACAGAHPDLPVCLTAGSGIGTCVECTQAASAECMGAAPVCDEATNTCMPCTEHDQCGEAACNLYTGACLPAGDEAVVHVGGAMPDHATIDAAVMSFAEGAEGTIIVHAGDYNESVTVDGGRTLAFVAAELGPGVEPPRWIRSSGSAPQLTVEDATVLLDGLQVTGNLSNVPPGVRVDSGRAWLDRSRIVGNNGGGIVAQNAAELVLRNCFVGGAPADVDAVTLNGSSLDMLYTTVGGGSVISTQTRALYCQGTVTANIRNSILVSLDTMPEIDCPAAILTDSATEAEVGFMATWFEGYATGDFHLSGTGMTAFAGLAQWQTGDPTTDIDGDPRPTTDGTADFAGADAVP